VFLMTYIYYHQAMDQAMVMANIFIIMITANSQRSRVNSFLFSPPNRGTAYKTLGIDKTRVT